MELNQKQLEIVKSDKSKVIVNSAAASGKTTCIKERVNYLLDIGISAEKIAVVTFTNAAAAEIRKRIGTRGDKAFIGTAHSLANKILLSNNIQTYEFIEQEEFDKLFELLQENKVKVPEIEHLLLDEAQDSSELQFEFFLNILKPKNYMLIGDLRQTIYSFNGSCPDYLIRLRTQPDVTIYSLNQNYRCGKNILKFAKEFLRPLGSDYYDDSIPMKNMSGFVKEYSYSSSLIIKILTDNRCIYKDWFILTRTNAQLDYICDLLSDNNIPYSTFKKADLTNDELLIKMSEPTVKVLTIHTAKGLENKNVIAIGGRCYNDEERRVCYVAATRAKEKLLWMRLPYNGSMETITSQKSNNFKNWD